MLADRIAPMEVTEYFVSPLGRAKATAAPTLARIGRTAVEYDWLQEFAIPVARPDRDGLSVEFAAGDVEDPAVLDRKRVGRVDRSGAKREDVRQLVGAATATPQAKTERPSLMLIRVLKPPKLQPQMAIRFLST